MQASTRAAGLRVDLTIVVSPVRSLTSIDQSFWPRNRQIKHHPGSAVSVRLHNRGGSTFLHLSVGVGDTLSVFHTSGRRAKTSCTRRMVASHAVPTHERTTLIASPELTRCTVICDLRVGIFRSHTSSPFTCSQKDRHFGVGH